MRRILQFISSMAIVGALSLALAPVAAAEPPSPQDVHIVARVDNGPHRHYRVVRHVRRVRHVHDGHVYYTRYVYYTRVYYR